MVNVIEMTDGYIMQRDYRASVRLNLQNYTWGDVIRGSLSYDILHNLEPSTTAKVADVGAGTGIWLMQLAERIPQAKLVGFDISRAQYPDDSILPDNVQLETWDFKTTPPSDWCDVFDIVHLRVMAVVVDDPTIIIANCVKLLKQGGTIIWGEYVFHTAQVVPKKAGTRLLGLDAISDAFKNRFATSWIANLDDTFKEMGLMNPVKQTMECKKWQRRMLTETFIMGMAETADTYQMDHTKYKQAAESTEAAKNAEMEVKDGNYLTIEFQVVTAKKRGPAD